MKSPEYPINVGELTLSFHRTVRVPRKEGLVNALPASLGLFPVYKVEDFKKAVPENWKSEGHFIPMYPQEALWIAFGQPKSPVALLVGAGMVNAVTGSKLETKLESNPQNYLTVPPQPWLDGFKRSQGESVYQFVAAQLGSGETVEEQILDSKEFGGIQIGVYDSKIPLIHATRPHEYILGGLYPASFSPIAVRERMSFLSAPREMGLGVGGAIKQKIYPDPYLEGKSVAEVWNENPTDKAFVYIVHSMDFKQITGKDAPSTPVNFEYYQKHGIPWFGLPDGEWKDVEGSEIVDTLKPVSETLNPQNQDIW